MPRQTTLKSIFVNMVVFVGMFALLGHLSMNLWERFMIQTELSNMKTSLHSLKETIHRIGYAYDHLHQELLQLFDMAEKKEPIKVTFRNAPDRPQSNKNQNVDSNKIPVEVIKNTNDNNTATLPIKISNKTIQHTTPDIMTQNNVGNENDQTYACSVKDTSTLTSYPPKSTVVSTDNKYKILCPYLDYCKYRKSSNVYKYCKNFECYNPVYNWRF